MCPPRWIRTVFPLLSHRLSYTTPAVPGPSSPERVREGRARSRPLQATRFFSFIPVSNKSLPKQHKSGRESALRQVRLLLRLCKLPFAFLKTTAVIPFTVLVYGVNGIAVLQGVEAPRTLLVLEIVGKPHTKSPRFFSFTPVRNNIPSLLLRRWSCAATRSVVQTPVRQPEGLSMRRVKSTA